MKIIQCTDLHLPGLYQDSVHEVHSWSVFESLLEAIDKECPDLLVITGDIAAHHQDWLCYQRLQQKLSQEKYPWIILKGNHDRGEIFEDVFGSHCLKSFWKYPLENGNSLLFLDTSEERENEQVLKALSEFLNDTTCPNFLFTHYPPIEVGHQVFDEIYPLLWKGTLLEILLQCTTDLYIFFGHIHFEFESHKEKLHFYSVPSATLPFMSDALEFTIDAGGSYYRKILISNAGEMETEVVRITRKA